MEELLLGSFLARNELNIVDQEEIDVAVLGAKLCSAVVADRIDELVGEAFRREVEEAKRRIEACHLVTDGVQEMRLAETDTAVDEERIVGLRWELGDRMASRLSKLVRIADDECVERVARRESDGCGWTDGFT